MKRRAGHLTVGTSIPCPALKAVDMVKAGRKPADRKHRGLSVLLRDHNDLERSRFCHAPAVCAGLYCLKICRGQVNLVGAIVDSHGLGTDRRLNGLDERIFPGRRASHYSEGSIAGASKILT